MGAPLGHPPEEAGTVFGADGSFVLVSGGNVIMGPLVESLHETQQKEDVKKNMGKIDQNVLIWKNNT